MFSRTGVLQSRRFEKVKVSLKGARCFDVGID